MGLQFRRVVTGHDASGRATVKIDEIAKNLVSSRPGATSSVVWTSQGFPVDNTGNEDAGLRETGTTLDNGTVFRILELAPGASPRNHRTDSIDYAVVMSGEIDMELDGIDHPSQGWRRAGAARHDPQLGQSRHGTLRHRFCADRRQTSRGRWQGAPRAGLAQRRRSVLVRVRLAENSARPSRCCCPGRTAGRSVGLRCGFHDT